MLTIALWLDSGVEKLSRLPSLYLLVLTRYSQIICFVTLLIVNIYRTVRLKLPENFDTEWQQFKKGYKNRVVGKIAEGTQATTGSDKLTFEQYRMLGGLAVASSTFYAHGF